MKEIYVIDNNNNKIKRMNNGSFRIFLPILDYVILILIPSCIIEAFMEAPFPIYLIIIVCIYAFIQMIIGFILTLRSFKYKGATMVKQANTITIIHNITLGKGYKKILVGSNINNISNSANIAGTLLALSGAIDASKEKNEIDYELINNIDEVLEKKPLRYKYEIYTDISLLKETKNYYLYIGNKTFIFNKRITEKKHSKFKIYKFYKKVDFINEVN